LPHDDKATFRRVDTAIDGGLYTAKAIGIRNDLGSGRSRALRLRDARQPLDLVVGVALGARQFGERREIAVAEPPKLTIFF
jgi:hypothetical protein